MCVSVTLPTFDIVVLSIGEQSGKMRMRRNWLRKESELEVGFGVIVSREMVRNRVGFARVDTVEALVFIVGPFEDWRCREHQRGPGSRD